MAQNRHCPQILSCPTESARIHGKQRCQAERHLLLCIQQASGGSQEMARDELIQTDCPKLDQLTLWSSVILVSFNQEPLLLACLCGATYELVSEENPVHVLMKHNEYDNLT